MLRRLLIPIMVLVVVGVVGTMCTALTGASARRRLQRAQRPNGIIELPAPAPTDSAPGAARGLEACPASLPDVSGWARISAEGSGIEIPMPPGFENVSQMSVDGVESPFLIVRALNGDEYRLTHSKRPYSGRELRQFEKTSSCRTVIGDVPVDIEIGRDTWRPGDVKVVIASFVVDANVIAFHGTAETAERQAQILAAVHNARFRTR
jgi:hypothetical protein